MGTFKKICYVVIAICIMLLAVKALKQSNGESVQYIKDNTVVVEDGKYHEENDGKIVAISGRLSTDKSLADLRFFVDVKDSARMERKVLEYRYYERKGDQYKYEQAKDKQEYVRLLGSRWEDKSTQAEYIHNSGYQVKEIFDEVTKDPSNEDVNAETYTLNPKLNGEFEIPEEMLKKFPCNAPVTIDPYDDPNQECTIANYNKTFMIQNNEFTTVKGGSPQVGDIRVSFRCLDLNKLGPVTVVAKQEDGKLVEYVADNEDIIYDVYKGNLSLEDIVKERETDNAYAIGGVIATLVVLLIVGLVVFRDNIADFMEKRNIEIKLNEKLMYVLVFIAFLAFFIGTVALCVYVFQRTQNALKAIPVNAIVTSYREEMHGSEEAYYYTYQYIVDDELYEREVMNTNSIPFDPSEATESGEIAEFEAYYDETNPSKSYIPSEREHSPVGYAAFAFFIAIFIVGMVRSCMLIMATPKKNKEEK
jgi:hypothetical protein